MGIEFDVQPKLEFYGERGRNRWGYCMRFKQTLFDCYAERFREGYRLFKKYGLGKYLLGFRKNLREADALMAHESARFFVSCSEPECRMEINPRPN